METLVHEGGFLALLPRSKGAHPEMSNSLPAQATPTESELDTRSREQLLNEIEYLRAELVYLKKLDALLQTKRQAASKKKRK